MNVKGGNASSATCSSLFGMVCRNTTLESVGEPKYPSSQATSTPPQKNHLIIKLHILRNKQLENIDTDCFNRHLKKRKVIEEIKHLSIPRHNETILPKETVKMGRI